MGLNVLERDSTGEQFGVDDGQRRGFHFLAVYRGPVEKIFCRGVLHVLPDLIEIHFHIINSRALPYLFSSTAPTLGTINSWNSS
jgi:hypothetical protein